jgi:hypothetical protein
MPNNPFSKAACPQVEHFYALFPEFNSYQTNADVPLFQQIFLKSVNLRPAKFIHAVRWLFLNLLKLDTWEFIQRFVLVKEVMVRHVLQRRMSASQSDDTNDLKKRLVNCVAVDRAV